MGQQISNPSVKHHRVPAAPFVAQKEGFSGQLGACMGAVGLMAHISLHPTPVLGPLQALPHASQAPARLRLPAARSAAPHPPLHAGADRLPGRALDPQIHRGCHHFPCHGKAQHCSVPQAVLARVLLQKKITLTF